MPFKFSPDTIQRVLAVVPRPLLSHSGCLELSEGTGLAAGTPIGQTEKQSPLFPCADICRSGQIRVCEDRQGRCPNILTVDLYLGDLVESG